MSILVIPDIHERIPKLQRILASWLPKVDEVVFLGDYFDSFNRSPETTGNTIDWLKDALTEPRFTLLMGNHDLHYLWPGHRCSGFHDDTFRLIRRRFDLFELRQQFSIATVRGGWLLSHAGLHPQYLPLQGYSWDWFEAEQKQAKLAADARMPHWIWTVGFDRGGWAKVGGPLWLGWENFVDDHKLPPQLVGHTEGSRTRQTGRAYCLDTSLAEIGLIHPGGLFEVRSWLDTSTTGW